MTTDLEVDVWVRGTQHATTHRMTLPTPPSRWTESEVRDLLSQMLLAIDREKNPLADPPPVYLRGFSWIVTPFENRGVLLHLEMQTGTASAGPIAIDERRLSEMVARVMEKPDSTERVH
jgi:hypothetical protein